ncbi:hypothetical protein N9K77_01820 [bacterium]|nr:hypothetical protein [bacterium]
MTNFSSTYTKENASCTKEVIFDCFFWVISLFLLIILETCSLNLSLNNIHGVAKEPIKDWKKYELELMQRLGIDNKFIRNLTYKAKISPKKVVFAGLEIECLMKTTKIFLL